jgi:hypothetical protein
MQTPTLEELQKLDLNDLLHMEAAPKPVPDKQEVSRISAVLPAKLHEKLKDYVIYTKKSMESFYTVNDAIVEAIELFLLEQENMNGGPFPKRDQEIKRGRRPTKKKVK